MSVPEWLKFQIEFGFIYLAGLRLFIILVAIFLMAMTWYLLYRTTWGIRVRAVMQDGCAIKHIKNPSEVVMRVALSNR